MIYINNNYLLLSCYIMIYINNKHLKLYYKYNTKRKGPTYNKFLKNINIPQML